jgi:hypothetical protein
MSMNAAVAYRTLPVGIQMYQGEFAFPWPTISAALVIALVPVVTAHAIAGVTWAPGPVRIGASVSTPFSIAGTASIGVRPPGAAAFDGALVRSRGAGCADVSDDDVRSDPGHPCRSTQADLSFDFPWILRVGAQLDHPVVPAWVLLDAQQPPQTGRLPSRVAVEVPSASQNISYMFQWWFFAAIAAGGYVLILRRHARSLAAGGATPAEEPVGSV